MNCILNVLITNRDLNRYWSKKSSGQAEHGRQAMSGNISFEAQIRSKREWRVMGIFADRDEAVFELNRLLESRRTTAVRVLQLVFTEGDGAIKERTVYRASCIDEENGRAARPALDERERRRRSRWIDGELFRPLGAPQRDGSAPRGRPWSPVTRAALACGAMIAASLLWV
jgi:hypothetical protein